MIDPGAIGTLMIRRRAAREELDEDRGPAVPARAPSRTPWSFVRAAFGRALRLAAKHAQPVEPASMAVGCGD